MTESLEQEEIIFLEDEDICPPSASFSKHTSATSLCGHRRPLPELPSEWVRVVQNRAVNKAPSCMKMDTGERGGSDALSRTAVVGAARLATEQSSTTSPTQSEPSWKGDTISRPVGPRECDAAQGRIGAGVRMDSRDHFVTEFQMGGPSRLDSAGSEELDGRVMGTEEERRAESDNASGGKKTQPRRGRGGDSAVSSVQGPQSGGMRRPARKAASKQAMAAQTLSEITGHPVRLCQLVLVWEKGSEDKAANWLLERGASFLAQHPELELPVDGPGDDPLLSTLSRPKAPRKVTSQPKKITSQPKVTSQPKQVTSQPEAKTVGSKANGTVASAARGGGLGAECEHGVRRAFCRSCWSRAICEHHRLREHCRTCGGG